MIILLPLTLILSGCSNKTDFELISVKADIVSDVRLTEEIKKGKQEYTKVPTSLFYEFKIKNIGNHTIK